MHDHDHDSPEHEHGDHAHDHGEHAHGEHAHEHHHHEDERFGSTGKVAGLIYDRSGAFDGFLLDTDDGERAFDSREPGIEDVAGRAWAERILTTVYADAAEPWRPVRIVLRA